MKYIYISNYVKMTQEKKGKFLNFMNRCKDFKVSNSDIVFAKDALVLGFLQDSNIQKAYSYFNDFFEDVKEVHIDLVNKSFNNKNQMILTFNNSNKQIKI
jgi:hypothetical protein